MQIHFSFINQNLFTFCLWQETINHLYRNWAGIPFRHVLAGSYLVDYIRGEIIFSGHFLLVSAYWKFKIYFYIIYISILYTKSIFFNPASSLICFINLQNVRCGRRHARDAPTETRALCSPSLDLPAYLRENRITNSAICAIARLQELDCKS